MLVHKIEHDGPTLPFEIPEGAPDALLGPARASGRSRQHQRIERRKIESFPAICVPIRTDAFPSRTS
jgi:hypothetical protein